MPKSKIAFSDFFPMRMAMALLKNEAMSGWRGGSSYRNSHNSVRRLSSDTMASLTEATSHAKSSAAILLYLNLVASGMSKMGSFVTSLTSSCKTSGFTKLNSKLKCIQLQFGIIIIVELQVNELSVVALALLNDIILIHQPLQCDIL